MPLLRRKALLLGGDTAALLAFAAIGRSNHGESLDFGSIVSVAWPFLAGMQGIDLQAIRWQTSCTLQAHALHNTWSLTIAKQMHRLEQDLEAAGSVVTALT